jgi:TPR repeat protein
MDDFEKLRLAAICGDGDAATALARFYADAGTPEGMKEAARWYEIGARHGSADSAIGYAGSLILDAGNKYGDAYPEHEVRKIAQVLALARLLGAPADAFPPMLHRMISTQSIEAAMPVAAEWLNRRLQ